MWGELNDNVRQKVELVAALLYSSPAGGNQFNNANSYDLYVTKTGKLAMHEQAFDTVWDSGLDREKPKGATFHVFRSFDQFSRDEKAIRLFSDTFPTSQMLWARISPGKLSSHEVPFGPCATPPILSDARAWAPPERNFPGLMEADQWPWK